MNTDTPIEFGKYWTKSERKKSIMADFMLWPPTLEQLKDRGIPEHEYASILNNYGPKLEYIINGCKWLNSFNCSRIIDVGCGSNQFKGIVQNVVGIDKFNESADIVGDIETVPFSNHAFDGAIILGSIQFIDKQTVLDNFSTVMKWMKPGSPIWFKYRQHHADASGFPRFVHNKRKQGHTNTFNYPWSHDDIEHIKIKYKLTDIGDPWKEYNYNRELGENTHKSTWHKFIKDPK
jgi:hypothetical protein